MNARAIQPYANHPQRCAGIARHEPCPRRARARNTLAHLRPVCNKCLSTAHATAKRLGLKLSSTTLPTIIEHRARRTQPEATA